MIASRNDMSRSLAIALAKASKSGFSCGLVIEPVMGMSHC
jgi:hypothetical protein